VPPIGFLSPLFLLGAFAVAVPVVLHLFRRRADPIVPFGAMRFLRRMPVEDARRRRLHDLLLLALRAAALLLLALGFARPYLQTAIASAPAAVTVVAVDLSASMGDAARAARTIALARQAVDRAPRGDTVAVVGFAAGADILVAPTGDRAAARSAIDRLSCGFGPTRYRSAIARTSEILQRGAGRLVLVTDLQADGWAQGPNAALAPEIGVETLDVGPQPPNVGIVALDRTDGGVKVALRGTGRARAVTVALTLDDQPLGEQVVRLPEDGPAAANFQLTLPATGVVRARLTSPDGPPADDERWLVLDARAKPRVLIVMSPGPAQPDALYVRRALEAAEPDRALEVVARSADRLRAEDFTGASVAIVVGTAGLDRSMADRLASFVGAGGGLLLPVGPAINLDLLATAFGDRLPRVRVGPPLTHPLGFVIAEGRHPLFRAFGADDGAFEAARFSRVAALGAGQHGDVLARFDDGAPALIATTVGRGRTIVLASDMSNRWNDLVLQPAFVPLLLETTTWLAGARSVPDGLIAGDADRGDAQRPGVAVWRALGARADAPGVRVAVNVDPREMDPARVAPATFLAQITRGGASTVDRGASRARQREAEQRWWQYGLGLMLVSLVVESLIGRRA
jgi:hypothetical protein